MKEIEHDPKEPKYDRNGIGWLWWVGWAFVAYLWFDQWRVGNFNWDQIVLGFLTAFMLTGWAIDITGNKVPDSWRRKRQ